MDAVNVINIPDQSFVMEPKDVRRHASGKLVMCGGVFDIIHPGHVFFLSAARKLGDSLAVVVARDSTAKRLKRLPVVPEGQRREVVEALKPVDFAVLGYENEDFVKIAAEIRPDVIAIGHNQIHDEKGLKDKIKKAGIDCEVVRIAAVMKGDLYSTKKIIENAKKNDINNSRFQG